MSPKRIPLVMKTIILINLLCLAISRPASDKNLLVSSNGHYNRNLIDTSKYAIIKYNSTRYLGYGFDKDSKPANLSSADITKIEYLISQKVTEYNQSEKKGLY